MNPEISEIAAPDNQGFARVAADNEKQVFNPVAVHPPGTQVKATGGKSAGFGESGGKGLRMEAMTGHGVSHKDYVRDVAVRNIFKKLGKFQVKAGIGEAVTAC